MMLQVSTRGLAPTCTPPDKYGAVRHDFRTNPAHRSDRITFWKSTLPCTVQGYGSTSVKKATNGVDLFYL
jgi:hypothetical protein